MPSLNADQLRSFIDEQWKKNILATMQKYIRIPNVSPDYDHDWKTNGHMIRAVELMSTWIDEQHIVGLTKRLVQHEGETPLLFVEIAGKRPETVLLYGHIDKQPPLDGWREGLDPFVPVIEGDRLYGRGSADDGYASFSAITAIKALQEQGIEHPRCVIVLEACEESGSYNLPAYINELASEIGSPSLIVCLDSGCGDYDRLWLTSSLRGVIGGVLRIEVLTEGVHSGAASGVVPSSFRIARQILSRIEDAETGRVLLPEMWVDIPVEYQESMEKTAEIVGDHFLTKFPFAGKTKPVKLNVADALRAETWEPALSVTGASGFPPSDRAGNVLRPFTELKLSMRIPPGCDPQVAAQAMKRALEADPPYDATVSFRVEEPSAGWSAPVMQPWLNDAVRAASREYFGSLPAMMGEGGSIPFMHMLGKRFPEAQFVITGVLGPESNAHGPNEFLHIPTFQKITATIATILACIPV
jgi:acetylornithine deacetylase/succinyl-diaminopimelate desuccinylase-like protein